MKQVLIRDGRVIVADVPAPNVEPGCVLVKVLHSCISAGTELSGIMQSGMPLWKRAVKNPEKALNALSALRQKGITQFQTMVEAKLHTGTPTGYSAAGLVVEVGEDVTDFKCGDYVACAGAQCANHAEWICVPANLAVVLPKNVRTEDASTVAIGAIALQGIRRLAPTIGETIVVVGLGILGQITAQLLRANGCRVIAVEPNEQRRSFAESMGPVQCLDASGDAVEAVFSATDCVGADGVIVTAATPAHDVLSAAFRMCRRKARVVLVGDVGLHLKRADIYEKELDFLISTSYGPGRYDQNYEEKGLDYPIGYVRWTEGRNMSAYLQLISTGLIDIKRMITAIHPIEDAEHAYGDLNKSSQMATLLQYPAAAARPARKVINVPALPAKGRVRLGVVGPGEFARAVHLPNSKQVADLQIAAIVSRKGSTAAEIARTYGAEFSTTEFQSVLEDKNIDAVLISTRHNLHARMALDALMAGKHVFLEKPLALTGAELKLIEDFYLEKPDHPILLTGFNRRFSPHARQIAKLTSQRNTPLVIDYTMNAGFLPMSHWVHGEEGGGRNLGEACHIYDLFTFLTGSSCRDVSVICAAPHSSTYSGRDNFIAIFTFADGSIAKLTYTSMGAKQFPKETLQVHCDGKTISMNNYQEQKLFGFKAPGLKFSSPEKGHLEELKAFVAAVKNGTEWPIPLREQIQATNMALEVEAKLSQICYGGVPDSAEFQVTF